MSTPAKKTQAVASPKTGEVVPLKPQSEADAFLMMIERAARDPSVDLDRMERLMTMHRESKALAAQQSYTRALAEMQPKLPVINERGAIRNKNGDIQSRYAKWEDINEAISPLLAEHGFTLTFRMGGDHARVITTGILAHRDGHQEQTTVDLPVDTGPGRNAVQSVASSFSYGKRYCGIALLNITSRAPQDADDDATGTEGYITEEMAAELRDLMLAVGAVEEKFCKLFLKGIPLEQMPAKRFNDAVLELKAFGRNKGIRI